MKTRGLSPNSFKIRIIFLLLLNVMAVAMEILSTFNTGEINPQSVPKLQIVDKEMIYKVVEKPILLDGLAVTIADAFMWNESEHALLRESFMIKPVEDWTILVEDANTFKNKTGI